MIDVTTGNQIIRERVTDELIVAASKNEHTDGLVVINEKSEMITIKVDEDNIIPFINKSSMVIPRGQEIIAKLIDTYELRTSPEIYLKVMNSLITKQQYSKAANVACNSQTLRTAECL